MRSSVLLLALAAFTSAACSQALTPNMSGTGGSLAGSGGFAGGDFLGTGGVGGSKMTPSCTDLANEYLTAVSRAGSCQVGASGQCQGLVPAALELCACATYVNDTSATSAIRTAWDQAGCGEPAQPCGLGSCQAPLNNTCISIDGGSQGYCEYVWQGADGGPGNTGGFGGSGGASGSPDDGGLGAPQAVLYPSPYNAGAYMLTLSNVPISCQNTNPMLLCTPAGVTYSVSIQMPPEDIAPGTYALTSLINPSFSESGSNGNGPSDCWGGGGTFNQGTLLVVEASSTELVFQLKGTSAFDFDVNATTITAQRCAGATGTVSTL